MQAGSNERAPLCPQCGYDLRGQDSGRCPECGSPFDRVSLYGAADALVKQKWHSTQNVVLAGMLSLFVTPVALWAQSCMFWVLGPVFCCVTVVGLVRAILWRLSSGGARALASATPGLRRDYGHAFAAALGISGLLAGVVILGGLLRLFG